MTAAPPAILLADDEPSIVQLNRVYLTREGYTVHAARDGQEALELARQIKAIMRRAGQDADPNAPLSLGNLDLDPARLELRIGGKLVALRTQEFQLLRAPVAASGRVLTREHLLHEAWGYDYLGKSRTVDVHVAALRERLAASTAQIQSVRGVGYKIVEPEG